MSIKHSKGRAKTQKRTQKSNQRKYPKEKRKESPSNYEVFYVLLNVLTDFVPVKQLCGESKLLSLTKFVKTVLFDNGKIGLKIFCVFIAAGRASLCLR